MIQHQYSVQLHPDNVPKTSKNKIQRRYSIQERFSATLTNYKFTIIQLPPKEKSYHITVGAAVGGSSPPRRRRRQLYEPDPEISTSDLSLPPHRQNALLN